MDCNKFYVMRDMMLFCLQVVELGGIRHVIKPGMETEMERNKTNQNRNCPLFFLSYIES